MAKRIQVPVQVALQPGGSAPARFWRAGTVYTVQRVETVWKETGAWWDGEGERIYFRVFASSRHATQTGYYELCCLPQENTWSLVEVLD